MAYDENRVQQVRREFPEGVVAAMNTQRNCMTSAKALVLIATTCSSILAVAPADAQSSSEPICASDASPYRDLDFLVGAWEFFTVDGRKIADQIYSRREMGCLILEDWNTLSGETGTGMNFVDPFTGKWRQVWMSPRFHLDYSGGLVDTGLFVLEGRMYPNDGSGASEIKGIYTQLPDGSVRKEFLGRSDGEWESFFVGVARRPTDDNAGPRHSTARKVMEMDKRAAPETLMKPEVTQENGQCP